MPVVGIGPWAFYSTSVVNVTIPDSITGIGDGAFFDCESLTNITIGGSVTNIGDWTFAFCSSLEGVCFRGSAPSLGGDDVFYGNLATIYYLPGTTGWGLMFAGHPAVVWNPPVPFDYTTNNDDTITITGYTGSAATACIPSAINFLPVTSIGDSSFAAAGLTGVSIPSSVTTVGNEAFGWSDLAIITIPDSVTNMGYMVFYGCTSLTNAVIGNGIPCIGGSGIRLLH